LKKNYCVEYTSDWAESYNNLHKARSPTGIYKYLNGSNIYYKHFEKQYLI